MFRRPPRPQRYGAIFAIALGITVSVLDGAIANVALPTIARDLNASPASSIWVVNAYQLAITVSLLSLASLGDLIGYRRIYQAGLLVFSITSLFCALSDSLLTLTIARVLQGFGAAAIMSVNTALIRIIYPQRFLGRGMGINSLIVACSSAAGPTVAAAILSVASAMAVRHQPADRPRRAAAGHEVPTGQRPKSDNRRFDPTSAVLNALTFGLLITAISGFARAKA